MHRGLRAANRLRAGQLTGAANRLRAGQLTGTDLDGMRRVMHRDAECIRKTGDP